MKTLSQIGLLSMVVLILLALPGIGCATEGQQATSHVKPGDSVPFMTYCINIDVKTYSVKPVGYSVVSSGSQQ